MGLTTTVSPELTPEGVALDVAGLVHPLDHLLDHRDALLVALLTLWWVWRVALEANVRDPHVLVWEALVPHFDLAFEFLVGPVVVDVEKVELALWAGADEFVDPGEGVGAVAEMEVSFKCGTRWGGTYMTCLLYTSPSPRDRTRSRMPSSA